MSPSPISPTRSRRSSMGPSCPHLWCSGGSAEQDGGSAPAGTQRTEEADMAQNAHGIAVSPGQPVVGLDFDGVLNITARGDLPDGFALHLVELDRENWPHHPYIRPLPEG